jgi:hypothetical protein
VNELDAIVPDIRVLRSAARSEDEEVVAEGTGLAEFLALALEDARREPPQPATPPPTTRRFGDFVAGGTVLRHLTGTA